MTKGSSVTGIGALETGSCVVGQPETDGAKNDNVSVKHLEVTNHERHEEKLRVEHIHGRKLLLAFLGWLMTEFMGSMVSDLTYRVLLTTFP